MDDERHWFEKFTMCMEQNIRGVQYGVYSVALIGLAVAIKSVKPFKKFVNPLDIPPSFVEQHLRLNGRVIRIESAIGSAPPLLHVDHFPIISTRWYRPTGKTLPVQISSVDISSNGLSWLQHIVVGATIKFTILKVDPSSVSCIVTKDRCNVGLELVSLGFASVSSLDFALEKDPAYLRYYKYLLAAENKAERKGSGMWAREQSAAKGVLGRLSALFFKNLWSKIRPSSTSAVSKRTAQAAKT